MDKRQWVVLAIALSALCLAGWLALEMYESSTALTAGSASGKSVVDLELVADPRAASAIVGQWAVGRNQVCSHPGFEQHSLLACAARNLALDMWFIPAYVVLALSLVWLLIPVIERRRPLRRALLAAPVAAGALDYVENVCLGQVLAGRGGPVDAWLTRLGSSAATGKFLLLVFVAIALAIALTVRVRAWAAGALRSEKDDSPEPLTVSFREGVEPAERAYQERRRVLADDEAKEVRAKLEFPKGWIGLALSGGGIRSATFNLGTLQALARKGRLPLVDYLSTVSGGGYIGSALSSLLSLRCPGASEADRDPAKQYEIPPGRWACFSTRREKFPFERETDQQPDLKEPFDARAELDHLRSRADFLFLRRRLIHRDVLRAVGQVLGGIFYHLLAFLLFLSVAAGLYLMVLGAMIGPLPRLGWGEYWQALTSQIWGAQAGASNPFWLGAMVGSLVLGGAMALAAVLVWSLPDRWFVRHGDSIEDVREHQSAWALLVVTALAALLVTCAHVSKNGPSLPALMLPLGVYVGGWAVALLSHWPVNVLGLFGRNERSRFAAWKGIFNYLIPLSFGVACLPWAIHWLDSSPDLSWKTSGLAAVGGLLYRWLAGGMGAGEEGSGPMGIVRKLFRPLLRLVLALLAAVVILGTFVLLCVLVLRLEEGSPSPGTAFRFCFALWAGLGLIVLGFGVDFNRMSLHYFYRDRLVETYLQTFGQPREGTGTPGVPELLRDDAEMPLTALHGLASAAPRGANLALRLTPVPVESLAARKEEGAVECVTSAPYHVLSCGLNLTRSRDLARRSQRADSFELAKLYCGSTTTGFLDTRLYRGGETKLARAMTISGAAVSTAMGAGTFFAQSFFMTLFNARLGQWLENPRHRGGRFTSRRESWVFWPWRLVREMLGSTDAAGRLIHLSDGAHSGDNVGIYPLLRRRCQLILACDAEHDPGLGLKSFLRALNQAEIDRVARVEIDLAALRPDPESRLSRRGFAVGRVTYPPAQKGGSEERGWLILIKAAMVPGLPSALTFYRQRFPDFPHVTTADLAFDDAQHEAYRLLGELLVERALGPELVAVVEQEGWRGDFEADLPGWLPARREPSKARGAPAGPA
ncbi:MAG TPA: patatin-like phospholipase family protein [Thermoanaerobaculia bacterium]|nr:patatin-like phospholipase family protein [Thermoanaerobaculia bacterium]